MQPVNPNLYISDFSSLETTLLPWRANVHGVVDASLPPILSSNGNPMQSFTLLDTGGKFLRCLAMGRHCGSEALENKTEVIIFFSQAKAGTQEGQQRKGVVWVFNESHVVVCRRNVSVRARREIRLQ